MGHGSWIVGYGSWDMGRGSWDMGHGSWVHIRSISNGKIRSEEASVALCAVVYTGDTRESEYIYGIHSRWSHLAFDLSSGSSRTDESRMPDEAISNENECHMHFLARFPMLS